MPARDQEPEQDREPEKETEKDGRERQDGLCIHVAHVDTHIVYMVTISPIYLGQTSCSKCKAAGILRADLELQSLQLQPFCGLP